MNRHIIIDIYVEAETGSFDVVIPWNPSELLLQNMELAENS